MSQSHRHDAKKLGVTFISTVPLLYSLYVMCHIPTAIAYGRVFYCILKVVVQAAMPIIV